jgi:dihydrofolate reductase
MKATVFIATSVDGFIARLDGRIDWLTSGTSDAEKNEDYGYQELMNTVDTLVMGRNTYETVAGFDQWPYGEKRVIVLTSRSIDIPSSISSTVESLSAPPAEIIPILQERGTKHPYIDGGKTIQSFLAEGLIQQLIITKIPVLIGTGIPLFGPVSKDIQLHHVLTKQYPNGFVQDHYKIR